MANEAEKIVADFCKAFERKNIDEIMAYFAEDAVYHNMPMEPAKGRDAIRATINSFLPGSNRIEFKILHTASNGSIVFNERIDMFDIGEKRVEVPVAGMFEVRGGKITLWRDYFDLPTYTKQIA
ncbi:MAG TPA: limonene-1,2-epoxide hydrolase family protein [Candidatus Binataceae bacterium]|nr:limonene-1,2-epoxide hydrolase family protein [Candidatus Binataceae bacterium]